MLDGRRLTSDDLRDAVREARDGTLRAIADLPDAALVEPRGPTINPLLWEVGHVAWFQERRATRRDG
ncbi:MAG: DinB family protein, partial [Planctomycetota bacterium JB042]